MTPSDGASNRYEVGPRTTNLYETNCTSRATALRGRWHTRFAEAEHERLQEGSTAPSMLSVLACLRTTLMLLADDGAHQPVTGAAQSPA